ncbi:hypothetical protein ACOMHN_052320 [Nucella lapillus]
MDRLHLLRSAHLLGLAMAACVFFTVVTTSDPPAHPHPDHQHQRNQPHPHPNQGDFDTAFRQFLRHNNYTGGSVAAMKDGRLLLAKGYGVTREGTEVKVGSRSPVSSLSQSLTAVGVLRLAQQGLVGLEDKVFGEGGLLSHLLRNGDHDQSSADPRLKDITVGHLLRHSAGWDHSTGPLFDPVLNELYQTRGYAVPNIAQILDVPLPLDALSILRYTLSQPLHYTPGTRVVRSNVGYLLLGRVVEQVSGLPYEDYVKRFILTPCGLWHTRLGKAVSQHRGHLLDEDVPLKDTPPLERKLDEKLDMFDVMDPATVDSALGWYSTVFDMARFARCVFDGESILNDATLELLLQRQNSAPVLHAESWLCAGFHTNTRGSVWQDGDPHSNDVLLYHNLMANRDEETPIPDTWVVLLHGSHLHHLRHKTRELMRELGEVVRDKSVRNSFVRDLSDIDAENVRDSVLVKFQVDEHHLNAYLSAVKREGYNVKWVSPYTFHRHTYFIVISRLIVSTTESEVDFKVEHGLGEKQLLSKKLHMERHSYNLTFLQSYHSQSHRDSYTFLAIFRKHAYSTDTQLKYGTDHLPEPYDKLVQMYQEKQFHPLVQSVLPRPDGKEEHLSFVFLQTLHSKPVDFKNYYRLGDSKLEKTVLQNADLGRTLSFLDAYQLQGRARFAAVFTNETKPRWHFQGGLTRDQCSLLIQGRLPDGLWPSLLVAYTNKDKEVRYAVFLKSDEDAPHASQGRQSRGHQSPRSRAARRNRHRAENRAAKESG